MTPQELREDHDWTEAFHYAQTASNPTTRETRKYDDPISQVVEVIAVHADSPEDYGSMSVVGCFRMTGGEYLFLEAGCDTTGWDCQAGGQAEWHADLATLRASISEENRKLLGMGETPCAP